MVWVCYGCGRQRRPGDGVCTAPPGLAESVERCGSLGAERGTMADGTSDKAKL